MSHSDSLKLHHIELDLRPPVFTHSQLYVALYRATNVANLTVLLSDSFERKTVNSAYQEALQHSSDSESIRTIEWLSRG